MPTESFKLVLASQSPRRQQLMHEAGYSFDVIAPSAGAECGSCSSQGPAALVGELAFSKAIDVRRQLADRGCASSTVIIAADTVAECDGQILGKPVDAQHARRMLELLSGKRHRVYTGVCVWPYPATTATEPEPLVEVEQTTLRMDELSATDLDDYVQSDAWIGKAGGFGYQDGLDWIQVIAGGESNVVGLPMPRLARMLDAVGAEGRLPSEGRWET